MDIYEFKTVVPNRWKWWCKLRNHWRRSARSVIHIFNSENDIEVTLCEWCGSKVKDD